MRHIRSQKHWLANSLVRVTRIHYLFALAFGLQIIIYDAGHLITMQAVMWRWICLGIFVSIVTIVWYLARTRVYSLTHFKWLTVVLVLTDIALASYCVYTTRGMASRAVMLYAIPIITSGVLLSRTALYASAFLSIAAYVSTTVAYFVLNFNEGYKLELYGEVGFYCAVFLIIAGLVWGIIKTKRKSL